MTFTSLHNTVHVTHILPVSLQMMQQIIPSQRGLCHKCKCAFLYASAVELSFSMSVADMDLKINDTQKGYTRWNQGRIERNFMQPLFNIVSCNLLTHSEERKRNEEISLKQCIQI